jgi:hypothetical protein
MKPTLLGQLYKQGIGTNFISWTQQTVFYLFYLMTEAERSSEKLPLSNQKRGDGKRTTSVSLEHMANL